MTIDWPVIGAAAGLAAAMAVVAIVAVASVRPGPEEVKKAPPPPTLWSARRPELTVSGDLQLFPGTTTGAATSGASASVVARKRPAPDYQLFPPEPATAGASSSVTAAPERLRRPPAEPTAARPAAAPEPKKTVLAYAPATGSPGTAKPDIHPQVQVEPPKIVDRRYDGVLTMAEIARLKSSLRLTAEQEPHWRPVEAELRQIGKLQKAQVDAGRKPDVAQSSFQQLYYAARPLLGVMRPDQKERVRGLARQMGYGSVASMI
jgi:hypothetical protein